jgi:hypothetical protein
MIQKISGCIECVEFYYLDTLQLCQPDFICEDSEMFVVDPETREGDC